jgi:hypothetical protein
MTMMRWTLMAGLLALAFCIPAAQAADDDIRLKLSASPDDDGEVRTLGGTNSDLDADTLEMRYYGGYRGGYGGYRGGYGGWGGYRGYVGYRGGYGGWGGYRGGYGGWGGYRGWGYGGYRGWGGYYAGYRGWGGYRGFYGGYYPSYGGYYGGYYPSYASYYSYPVYSYPVYSTYYYYPCATVAAAPTTTLDYSIVPSTPTPADPTQTTPSPSLKTTPAPPMPRVDGTYPYDGGPAAPVPMPKGGDEAMTLPRVPTPILDRVVSLKDEPTTGKYVYPAYGELPRRSGR